MTEEDFRRIIREEFDRVSARLTAESATPWEPPRDRPTSAAVLAWMAYVPIGTTGTAAELLPSFFDANPGSDDWSPIAFGMALSRERSRIVKGRCLTRERNRKGVSVFTVTAFPRITRQPPRSRPGRLPVVGWRDARLPLAPPPPFAARGWPATQAPPRASQGATSAGSRLAPLEEPGRLEALARRLQVELSPPLETLARPLAERHGRGASPWQGGGMLTVPSPVVLDASSPVPVTVTPAEGYPVPPMPLVVRCYATAADLAAPVVPLALTVEQGATLAGLLDAAGREVAARLARRYGCRQAVGFVRVAFGEAPQEPATPR